MARAWIVEWYKLLTMLSVIRNQLFLSIIFTFFWLSVADAYVLSGNVTNNSGKTGRVYILIDHYADNGTSIDSSGAFSISGVPSGTYTLTAVMDTRGDGKLFTSDPRGSSATFTVASADRSGIAITLTNPAVPAPPTPSWLQVYPGEGGAGVRWDIETEGTADILRIADHYNFYWSTSPTVAPGNTTGGGSKLGVPDPGWGGAYLPGLTNGTTLYFVVTSVVKGVEGLPSPVSGPVTIGPPTSGGVSIQGAVSMSGFTPTGPLCISLWGGDSGRIFMKCFASPLSVQAFQFDHVPDGYYRAVASVDMNNNGVEDIGDITAGSFEGTPPPLLVQGADVSGVAIDLPNKNSDSGVFTEFTYPNSYGLFFMAKNNRKLLTNMTVMSGQNLSQPIDIRRDSGGWFYYSSLALPGRPTISDSYNLNLRYGDDTTETPTVTITGILDGYATPVSPSGATSGLTPLMTWTAPSPPPSLNPFRYKIQVNTASGDIVWKNNSITSNRTYAIYNEDGTATPLISGTQYFWQVEVTDQHGNHSHGPKVYFTPTATPAKQLTVVSRNPASGVSIAVTPNDKNSLGNGASPFTRFYDTGTTVTLTAPATAGGNSFNSWSGCSYINGTQCTISLAEDKTATAVYSYLPPAPSGIISATGTGQVNINWNSVPGATSYNLYYSTTPGVTKATGTKIANVPNSYTVSSLTNGTPYYFLITAVNSNGEGAESSTVGAVPGMPNAYTMADLVGTWQANGIESPGPWWVRRTMLIASDGSFTTSGDIASSGPKPPFSGTYSLTSDGVGTIPPYTSLRCNLDAGRTVSACTNTNPTGAEMSISTKMASSYLMSDLTGNWEINQIGTPGAHWLQGTGTINPDGSSSFSINSDNREYGTLPGTVTITSDGRVSSHLVATNPDTNYSDCSMDAGKTVIVCVSTSVEHNESLLTIYTKKAASYSQSDMTGTWSLNILATEDAAPWWERGFLAVSTDGTFSGSLEEYGTAVLDNVSGTVSLNSTGIATLSVNPNTRCTMDAGKTVMVCTGDWNTANRTSEMIVWTKTGSVPQDITGRWETSEDTGVIGALLTQTGNIITGSIRGSNITIGSFSNGTFSGVFPGISNWPAGPYNLNFVLSADGQTLDGTFYVPGYGLEPVIFKRISNSPQNPDPAPPVIIASSPSPYQINVQRQNLVVSTTWSKPVNGWDMNLTGKIGGIVTTIYDLYDSSKFSYDYVTNTFNMPLKADIILDPMTTYTIKMDGGNDIDWYDPYGVPAWTNTSNAYSFTFTTGNDLNPTNNLGVTLSGSGSGSVNSNPTGPIACTYPPQSGICLTSQPVNTVLTLIATPGNDSSFGGWGNACSSCTGLSCLLSIDSDKTCTAAFQIRPLVRIAGPVYFGSIIKAYDQLSEGSPASMLAQAVELTENVDLNKSIQLTLQGGYDSAFNTRIGFTTLHGGLTVSRGSLVVDRLIVR